METSRHPRAIDLAIRPRGPRADKLAQADPHFRSRHRDSTVCAFRHSACDAGAMRIETAPVACRFSLYDF